MRQRRTVASPPTPALPASFKPDLIMFRSRWSVIAFLLATSVACGGEKNPSLLGKLYWGNGDILPGQLMETTGNQLQWKSELFREPLILETKSLSAVRFDHSNDTIVTDEPFRIITRSANVLHGNVTGINADSILVDSRRHGSLVLKRDQIRSLRRLDNPALIYLGPTGLNGWKTLTTRQKVSSWQTTDEGYLSTRRDKAELFRPLDIPGRAEIELVIESTKQLAFMLGLNDKPTDDVHLETWDDTLVALVDEEFVEIQRIDKDQRSLTLRIYWDEGKRQLSVFSESGAELGTIKGKNKIGGKSGVFIRNTGANLVVKKVRVSHWDGSRPVPVQKGENRIHLIDGTLLYGNIRSLKNQTIDLLTKEGESRTVPVDQIDSIYLADDIQSIADGSTNVTWLDGARVTGELTEVRGGRIGVKSNYSAQPIVSSLEHANRLLFSAEAGKPEEATAPDRLYCSGGTLHGTLVGNGDDQGAAALRWQPVGGLNSSPLAPNCDARFVRGRRTKELSYDKQKYGDLLFLISGDIVPCRVNSIDEEFLRITTAFAQAERIPHDNVKAIEFASTSDLQRSGFEDGGWRVDGSQPNIRKDDEKVVFESAGRISHQNVFSQGEATFSLEWQQQSYVALNLRLFTSGTRSGGSAVVLYLRGNQVWASDGNNFRTRTRSMNVPNTKAKVRLRVKDDQLSLLINDRELHSTRVRRAGAGMVIQVSQNQMLRGGPGKSKFVISDFESRRGTAVRQYVDSEARERALTVPRFRRDKPSTHVLIAPNGDLLRGRLLAVTEAQVRFSSRLEDFRFDRDRISAIIWLHPEGETEQPQPDEEAPIVRTVLDGGLGLVLIPERMTDEKLIGRSPVLGQCEVPVSAIRELFAGKYEKEGEVFAYADWSITPAMEPRWDVDDSGGGDPASQLIGRKAGDFMLSKLDGSQFVLSKHEGKIVVLDFWATWCGPCVRAMPEYLAAIEDFPKDKVAFVAVNQGETRDVIEPFLERREWQLPTVLLDEDTEVANSFQVAGIPHTVIVGPDGVIEWVHVGFSPGGGEELKANIQQMLDGTWERPGRPDESISGKDSKLVGTLPADFSMKMLDGSEFQLSKEKGNIVILDFWATWCGPCVRAFPEYLAAMEKIDSDKVRFIAVNQAEKEDLVKTFLERRELKMEIGLDPDGTIADAFEVESIPQTVIIGPDGRIEWLHIGYRSGVAAALEATVNGLLEATP